MDPKEFKLSEEALVLCDPARSRIILLWDEMLCEKDLIKEQEREAIRVGKVVIADQDKLRCTSELIELDENHESEL